MAASSPTRSDLLRAYEYAGTELATIYVPSPSAVEDAGPRLEIRKKNVSSALEEANADERTVGRVAEALDELDHAGAAAHLVVASPDSVLVSVAMDRPLAETLVHVGPCPLLLPILAATQVDVRHLAVLVDRTGADVLLRDGVGDPLDELEVAGPDVRVHRGHPGGWSQRRFQQTAENAWENNAREVVDQITSDHPDLDLLVCGGDVRAVGFFVGHLPERIEVVEVDGSRHSDPDSFLDEADVVLRSRAAAEIVDLVDRWQGARGQELGSTGLDVLDDLTQGRVDHLLVVDDTRDQSRTTSYFDFTANAHTPGDETNTEAPITDAAVALALATGAEVTVVPSTSAIENGLAALLRFQSEGSEPS